LNKIGIDLGGTKIEGILIEDDLKVLHRKRILTNQKDGYGAVLDRIIDLINQLQLKSEKNASIGVCCPGAIEPKTGNIKNSNTICLNGMPLKDDLEHKLKCKIEIENDANCFAIAEAYLGAAKDYQMVFGVIMGTGVGGGIVHNKKLHQGRLSIAGEWGHISISQNGPECYCGQRGCIEKYISGKALEEDWYNLSGEDLSLKKIISTYQDKPNDLFRKWKKRFLENFGRSLSMVVNILDPNIIVLGGGVSNIPFLYNEGKNKVFKNVFSNFVDTPILQNQLGDSAGVYGAALLNQFNID
tara:strand:+ start:39067 stop:39963 length:897 start_codon:yes stop_codon:yes gene_type:complete